MTRRALVCLCLCACLRADSADQVWDIMASMAAALSNGNAAEFMSRIDSAMPGYERLRSNITAMTRYAEVQTAIDPVANEGDDRARTLITDWLLLLKQENAASPSVRRRERLTCKMEKRGKKWVVVSLEPLSLFDAPRL